MIDIIVIGAGVTGCTVARELSRYRWRVAVLDRASDVCEGTSKANSGIVHAGYDAAPGSRKALLNVQGSGMMEALSEELEIVCDTLLLSCGLIPENELSEQAGIEMSRITNGPEVDESLETSIPGVFACGNVLHVHDLVDFVSQEAAKAGEKAAQFVLEGIPASEHEVPIQTGGLIRYTVPFKVDPARMDDEQIVRFRVGNILRGGFVDVTIDGERRIHKKRMIMAPGEMESIVLKKEWLGPETKEIVIETKEA